MSTDIELAEDRARLEALYTSLYTRVDSFQKKLEQTSEEYLPLTHTAILAHAKKLAAQISDLRRDIQTDTFSIEKKKAYGDLLRVLHAEATGLLSAPNWQSPSFWHTTTPQAGMEAGLISASNNDYKRDMHVYEKLYGETFVKEYVDHPLRLAPFAFPTSSGMSAVATVLAHLQHTLKDGDVVLAGRSIYFQNIWQLEQFFPGRVQYVDEFDTDEILRMAKELQPSIVFFDSLCGSVSIPMPHLSVLIPGLAKILSKRSTLVLDNTVLATMYQPLRDLPLNPFGMKCIVVESLLKYHQFGFDRVGGGIIWAPAGSENDLFTTRMYLGTIMPDIAVCAMPEPNRVLFDARLLRIGRNARILAEKLSVYAKGSDIGIIHPSLPDYRGYEWTRDALFQGPFITFLFPKGKQTVKHYDAFVNKVRKIAQERKVDIVGGTSFGFDITRLYVTARYATDTSKPFVRLSVGTETIREVEALAEVFAHVL